METLLQILEKSTDYLRRQGIENPRLDAELLMAHVLKCERMRLYLEFERPMDVATLDALRPLVRRRGQREPLQYITERTSFMGLELRCDARALIPRPETEELVELIIGDWHDSNLGPARILDVGTGTGAIIAALRSRFGEAELLATDVSSDALSLARENLEQLGIEKQVRLIESNLWDSIDGTFDLIVSNPPYLSESDLGGTEPEIRDYEPLTALVAPADGMACVNALIQAAPDRLNPGGRMYLEIGADQRDRVSRLISASTGIRGKVLADLSGRDRFVRLERN